MINNRFGKVIFPIFVLTLGLLSICYNSYTQVPKILPCPDVTKLERWPVKTLTDSTIGEIDFGHIHNVRIKDIDLSGTPDNPDEGPLKVRQPGIEWAVLRVTDAIFVDTVGVQSDGDGDLHINLRSASGRKLIIEFPDTDCIKDTPLGHKKEMRAARDNALRLCPTTQACSGRRFIVEGIGFWDNKHIEIHPVLKFYRAPSSGLSVVSFRGSSTK